MKILSIDASTKSTGLAIHEDGKLILYKCVVAEGANLYKRIDKMVNKLEELLLAHPDINEVYMEDVYPEDVHHNQNVYKALIYLQGFICHKLDQHNLSPYYFTSSEWRKKCGIRTGPRVKRDTLKERDILFVKDIYGIDVNDDIADAICIGYAAIHKNDNNKSNVEDSFEFG